MVTETACQIFNSTYSILYKKRMKTHNVKYVPMAYVMLHSFRLQMNGSCNLPGKLSLKEFELTTENINKQ